MRSVFSLLLFVSLFGFCATAQVLPTSNGSCGVSASGLMSCDWLSAPKVKFNNEGKVSFATNDPKGLFVTRFTLAPGAPLNRLVQGHDVLIVGMNDGEVVNEAKNPQNHVSIVNGTVMLMSKDEPYLLRNASTTDLDLLVIDVRR